MTSADKRKATTAKGTKGTNGAKTAKTAKTGKGAKGNSKKITSSRRLSDSGYASNAEKQQASRKQILEATIDCFIDIGYAHTTTTEIAKKAGFTRGAVQHYFPTTQHVVKESIKYLTEQWLDRYMSATRKVPPGADYIDYVVDTLWRFVNHRLFIAWNELVAAARTDAELNKIVRPAAARFEKARLDMAYQFFREDFSDDRTMEDFQQSRDTLRFLLEGMGGTIITHDKKARIDAQLRWLKDWLHERWETALSYQGSQQR